MDTNKKLNFPSAKSSAEFREKIDNAFEKAVHDALLKHKQANNPVAVWRNGKIVLLKAEEIPV